MQEQENLEILQIIESLEIIFHEKNEKKIVFLGFFPSFFGKISLILF